MTTFRNNGIKFRQESMTDNDVLTLLGNTADRAQQAQADLAHITGYALERGLIPEIDQMPGLEVGPQVPILESPDAS